MQENKLYGKLAVLRDQLCNQKNGSIDLVVCRDQVPLCIIDAEIVEEDTCYREFE